MFTLLGFKRKSETMNRSVTGQEKHSYLLYCVAFRIMFTYQQTKLKQTIVKVLSISFIKKTFSLK